MARKKNTRLIIQHPNKIYDYDERQYLLLLYNRTDYCVSNLSDLLPETFKHDLKKNNHFKYMRDVLVIFDDDMKNGHYGLCYAREKIIFINGKLKDSVDKLNSILIHEYAHILDFYLYNQEGHGKTWKDLMRQYCQIPLATLDLG